MLLTPCTPYGHRVAGIRGKSRAASSFVLSSAGVRRPEHACAPPRSGVGGGWGGRAAHYDHGIPHLSATPHGKGATRRSSSVVARTRRSTSGTVIMPRCLRCALIAVLPLHERMVMAHGSISRIGLRDGSIASAGACGSFGHRQRRCVEPVRPLYDGIC